MDLRNQVVYVMSNKRYSPVMDFSLDFIAPKVLEATESSRMVPSVTLTGHGSIKRIKVMDTPLPETVKDDEVEVDVYYCGMNFTDNYLRLGIIRNSDFPVIMGSECSGVVTRVGKRVTDLQEGQGVLCLKMHGGLFRHVVHVPRKHCFPVPDDISLKDAAGLGLHFLTAYLCLFEYGCLKPSQTIFVQSIAGGVGTAVIQLARTVPLVRIFGCASHFKHNKILSLGAAHVFYSEENYKGRLLKLYPEGADIVINSSGGSEVDSSLDMLRSCGKLINIGSNSSATYPSSSLWGVLKPSWDSKLLSSGEVTCHNYSVTGLNVGYLLQCESEKMQSIMHKIFQMRSSRKIRPCIHAVLPFDEVSEAMKVLCTRQNCGKMILVVKDEVDPPAEPSTKSEDSRVKIFDRIEFEGDEAEEVAVESTGARTEETEELLNIETAEEASE